MQQDGEILRPYLNHILHCIFFSSFIIVARLFYLQVNLSDYFINQGQKNFLRVETVHSPRGSILDSTGAFIATNRPVINVCWIGSGNRKLTSTQQHDLKTALALSGIEPEQLEKQFTAIQQAERNHREIVVARDIKPKQLSTIEEQFPNHPNIRIKTDFQRYYPHGRHASHLLGHLRRQADTSLHGQTGLERLLESHLRGTEGRVIKTVNSFGQRMGELELSQLRSGATVQTTLNMRLQALCENAMGSTYNGTIILMSPIDGSIRALVSRPNFDPNMFLSPIRPHEWAHLQHHSPFLNRAFSANYPPGSIFKLVTISAALEQNIVTDDQEWYCQGYSTLGKQKYWCHKHDGHGTINTEQAMAVSCNTFFFEIGKKIDVDTLAHYARLFGLGQGTNIQFPEQTGLIPDREWKMDTHGEQWWPGETLSVAIGQSFVLVTPIQTTRMIASIFSGYLVKPRTLISEPVEKVALDIKPKTLEFLKQSMKKVVTIGTGRRMNRIKEIEIYAKTSTAQTSSIRKRHLGNEHLEHGWFVGYFRYRDEEPLAITVLLENAGTAQRATTVARNLLSAYKQLVDQQHKTG